MTRLVHCKKEKYDVYIGRPGVWGNPFTIGKDGTRDEVIEKYRKWIQSQDLLLQEVHLLKGKILGCWCIKDPDNLPFPYVCHGQVLLELIEKNDPSDE